MARSRFQIRTVCEIEQRKDFKQFCADIRDYDGPYEGPVCVMWMDKQGGLNLWKLGQKRLLFRIRNANGVIVQYLTEGRTTEWRVTADWKIINTVSGKEMA